jgi:membrane-bound serine protease (ClpP class)
VYVAVAQGEVTTPFYNYIQRSVQLAEADGAEALVIQLDTPGGLVSSMKQIVQAIGESRVPVIVYVAPQRAMAASAGTLITLAGHAAAMAPDTIIGAASPVSSQGEDLSSTEATKVTEVMKAQARALAERRGTRAVQLAEETIETARAVSEKEALEIGLIDCVATDVNDLLRQLDGREVEVRGQKVKLNTEGVEVRLIAPNAVESLLRTILNPNISFLLLTIGVQAILIELSNPGGWVAGFIGAVCLALFIYSVGVIPVNWLGLVLIGIAFVLFFLDVQAPTHGALTLAGLGTFIAGALILFNTSPGPDQVASARLSVPLVIGTGIFTALFFGFIVGKAMQAQRRPAVAGVEALRGRVGRVQTALAPRGTVHVCGELWTAETAEGESLPAGTKVEVVRVDGLTLRVRRCDER